MTSLRFGIVITACLTAATSACGTATPVDPVATARSIARAAAADQEDARIRSVTMLVHPGRVAKAESNVGRPCSSGKLIEVKLIGDFPHLVTTGHPIRPGEHVDFTVHAVIITADALTGKVCLRGVQTGNVEPDPGARDIKVE